MDDKNAGHVVPGPICDPDYARAMGRIWFWNEVRIACGLLATGASGGSLIGCIFLILAYESDTKPFAICLCAGLGALVLFLVLRAIARYLTDKAVRRANRIAGLHANV